MTGSQVTIRPLKKDEVAAVAEIAAAAYAKPEFENLAASDLESMFFENSPTKPMFLVAEKNGEVVGFVGYVQSMMEWVIYELCWLTVTPAHQKSGVGGRLLEEALCRVEKAAHGRMVALATTSPSYFEHHGFDRAGGFTGVNGEPTYLMTKTL